MNRSPMKRGTGFARPAYVRPPAPPPSKGRVVAMARVSDEVAAIPKMVYVRSKKLLAACRDIPCQHCGRNDGTVVAAHSNELRHGKGRSCKASDQYVASMCFDCHRELDQGAKWSKAERQGIWDAAHRKTVALLVAGGAWPLDVPVPDTRRMN